MAIHSYQTRFAVSVKRTALLHPIPITAPYAAILLVMLVSMLFSGNIALGYIQFVAIALCVILIHLTYTILVHQDLDKALLWMTVVAALSMTFSLLLPSFEGGRQTGVHMSPNSWSFVVLNYCPLFIASLLNHKTRIGRLSALVLFGMMSISVAQTLSRGSIITLMVMIPGFLFLFWTKKKEKKKPFSL